MKIWDSVYIYTEFGLNLLNISRKLLLVLINKFPTEMWVTKKGAKVLSFLKGSYYNGYLVYKML